MDSFNGEPIFYKKKIYVLKWESQKCMSNVNQLFNNTHQNSMSYTEHAFKLINSDKGINNE